MLVALTLTMSANTVFATTNTTTNISDQDSGQVLDNTTVDSSTAQAAGSPTDNTSFTTEQITAAATKVKTYTDNHNTLPGYVIIGDTKVTMPQFLKLMVQNILNNETNESVTLENIDDPVSPNTTETVTDGNLTYAQYTTLARLINTYMNKYGVTTSSAPTDLGKMNYNNLVYTFSKILNFANTYDRLPSDISITTWSNIVNSSEGSSTVENVSEGSSSTSSEGSPSEGSGSDISFTSDQINAAAYKVKTFIETYSRLPGYVTIGDTQVTMAQFLKLMVQNVININNGSNASVTLESDIDDAKSTSSTETVTSGNLTCSEFVSLANQINSYINKYGLATSSATSSLGKMNFNNLVYTFSKILNFANTNDRLPNYVSVSAQSLNGTTTTTSSSDVQSIINAIGYAEAKYLDIQGQSSASVMESVGYGDCWADSYWLYNKLSAAGISVRIVQCSGGSYPLHRWVQINIGSGWVNWNYSGYSSYHCGSLGTAYYVIKTYTS